MKQMVHRAYFKEVAPGQFEFAGRFKDGFQIVYFENDLSMFPTDWLNQFLDFVISKVAFGCHETTRRYEWLMYQTIDELKRRGEYNGIRE